MRCGSSVYTVKLKTKERAAVSLKVSAEKQASNFPFFYNYLQM